MRHMRSMPRLAVFGLLAASTLAVTPSAQAASTLDQSVTDTTANTTFNSTQWLGQSFTAGITGALTRIDIPFEKFGNPTDDVTVTVYAAASGLPTGSALATTAVRPGVIPTMGGAITPVEVTFSPAPQVIAGSQYAFTLTTTQVNVYGHYLLWGTTANVYAGGTQIVCLPACGWQVAAGNESSFSTYVDPGEPGTPSVSTPQWTLDFVPEGGICTSTSATRLDKTWLQLPDASACTKPGHRLAGWIARQTDGPLSILFAPGAWTFMTGDNHVHAVWTPVS